jgi:hypothetical protein
MEVSGQLQTTDTSALGKEALVLVKEEVIGTAGLVRLLLRRGTLLVICHDL